MNRPKFHIPYGRQCISDEDVAAVVETLRSDWLTQGPAVPAFEAAVAQYCRLPYGVAANSATSALHLACLALDLRPGDRLWTVPNTFVASANCGLYCGAQVDFVDIDPRTYNMSLAALEDRLVAAKKQDRLPKIVVPVHFSGQSCDMEGIAGLAERYGFRVIEDASHAIGASWQGQPVGACQYSDIAVFSFHPVKIITSAEGGMAMTADSGLARRMSELRSHGIVRAPAQLQGSDQGAWFYEQQALGFNYRMTDVQAALGLSQFKRLDTFLERRRALAARYSRTLAELPLTLPFQDSRGVSAWHLYVVLIQASDQQAAHKRRLVFDALRARGIGVNVHYIPVHMQPFHAARGSARGTFPQAEAYYDRAISIPLYYGLSDAQQDTVVAALRSALEAVG